jgi:hypothetical protein
LQVLIEDPEPREIVVQEQDLAACGQQRGAVADFVTAIELGCRLGRENEAAGSRNDGKRRVATITELDPEAEAALP